MFRLRATVTSILVLQAGLGAGCGGMTQDGPGGTGGTGGSDGGPVDGSSDTGGSIVLDGYADDGIIYDGQGGWGAGSTGGGGTGGVASQCGECFPYGSSCEAGVVSYRFSWGSACPPAYECNIAEHVCALGCREEGAHWDTGNQDVFAHCEDTSVRGPGFPCRADIDCATPVGATLASNLSSATGLGGAGSDSGELRCSEEGTCAFGLAEAVTEDFAESCSIVTSAVQPGPVVGFTDSCQSGACLVPDGGLSEGACTVSCETHTDCPVGYGCVDVLDNRYSVWDYVADLVPPPRILACVPGSE